jgi:hypothetical protein
MKKFNKVISVEVAVDDIANQLLAAMNSEFKHKEIVVESTIGVLLNTNKLSHLYNALNGYTGEIDFKVGDMVDCNEKIYQYIATEKTDTQTKYEQQYLPIGQAIVEEIDIYRDEKLKVSYRFLNSRGEMKEDTKWVSHLKCNKMANYGQVAAH